jgi:hypothetical protein
MLDEPCKFCGAPVDRTRSKLCRKCYSAYQKTLPSYQIYNQEKVYKNKPSYQKRLQDKSLWHTYPKTCEACGAAYEAINNCSRLCLVCYARQQELKTASNTRGQYKQLWRDGRKITEHRYLAKQVFGRQLAPDENVHHLDEDPKHNELSNLVVLSHNNHLRLHRYLEVQQVIEKQRNPKPWSELVVPLSIQWLRINNIPHLLLSELKAFKDQLFKQPVIGSQPEAVQHHLETKILYLLRPWMFRPAAKTSDGFFTVNVA